MREGIEKLATRAYLDKTTRTSLHRTLGYSDEARIPRSVFEDILKAKPGTKVRNVKVTPALQSKVRKALASRTEVPRAGAGRHLFGRGARIAGRRKW